MHKFLISANCQTYGIAAALSAMCDIPPPVCIQNIGVPAESLREQLLKELQTADVFIYAAAQAQQQIEDRRWKIGECPVTEDVADRLVRLPFFTSMTEGEQGRVVDLVREWKA